jgi:hypothetical protein
MVAEQGHELMILESSPNEARKLRSHSGVLMSL